VHSVFVLLKVFFTFNNHCHSALAFGEVKNTTPSKKGGRSEQRPYERRRLTSLQ